MIGVGIRPRALPETDDQTSVDASNVRALGR